MHSLIKCSIFTIYANNLLESIKILYKFNNLVNIIGCNIYSLGIFGHCDIDRYFLGYAKNRWYLFWLKIKVGSEPM